VASYSNPLLSIALALAVSASTAGTESPPRAAMQLQPRLYELTTETIMPHLEENLRYTITHAQRCVQEQDLRRLFPVLEHPALQGCTLQNGRRELETISYTLVCSAPDTHGHASWELGKQHLRGTLEVRLGGKNMTFSQRIHARALGPCSL
jgi:hypothetical protein